MTSSESPGLLGDSDAPRRQSLHIANIAGGTLTSTPSIARNVAPDQAIIPEAELYRRICEVGKASNCIAPDGVYVERCVQVVCR